MGGQWEFMGVHGGPMSVHGGTQGAYVNHGCILFDFLAEFRGNDRGTSADFSGWCCHGLPCKSAGLHGKCHGSWHFHGKCHGCDHRTCRVSVRGKLRRTNHSNPRKSAETAFAISTAIRGHCHSKATITTEIRGYQRQLPRQFPRKSNRKNSTATLRE